MKVKYYRAIPQHKRTFHWEILHRGFTLIVAFIQWLPELLHCFLKKPGKFKYDVSLCLIFKNEAPYLKQWLEYHLLIGVKHFYLYDNGSDDESLEVLRPYMERKIVTLTSWPEKHAQVEAYNDCYNRFRHESHWIGFIDTDEYVNLRRDNNISDMLRRYRRHPSLILQWRMFGTSGWLTEDISTPVTERFVAAWPWLTNVGKSFINNDYNFSKIWVHEHTARFLGLPLYAVGDNHLPSPKNCPLIWSGVGKTAVINHYFSKSREYIYYKDFVRGSGLAVSSEQAKKTKGRFELHELNNFTHDYSIQRWLVFLKERLKTNENV